MPHREAGFFVDGSDANGVLILAVVATPKETLVALARLAVGHFVNAGRTAMNATRGFTPTLFLEKFNGGGFVRTSQWDIIDRL